MKRFLIGVLLATLATYFWGFLYWGLNPLPYSTWKHTADDVAAGQALLHYFPVNGTYHLPGIYNDKAQLPQMFEKGPVAFVHMLRREGRPMEDPAIMAGGFVLYLFVSLAIGALLRMSGLAGYGARVRLVLVAGIAASLMIDIGDAVWWYIPWDWKLMQALYNVVTWLIAGAVLAKFVNKT